MNIFIKELTDFSNKVDCPISSTLLQKYNQLSKECNPNDKSEINKSEKKNIVWKSNYEIIDLENGNIEVEKPIKNVCCDTGCFII